MTVQYSQTKVRNPALKIILIGVSVLIGLLFIASWLIGTVMFSDQLERAGQFGDMFGAVNALFAGAGLIAVAVTLLVQNQAELEAQLNSEYRAMIPQIGLAAWTEQPIPPGDQEALATINERGKELESTDESLLVAYRYFDLCNSQGMLREQGKISRHTWRLWEEGISENLRRPWFLSRYLRLRDLRGRESAHFKFVDGLLPNQPRL